MTPACFDDRILTLDRNEAPYALYMAWVRQEIADADLPRLIPTVWAGAEFPASIGQRVWLEMFKAAGVMGETASLPDGHFTAYRGACASKARGFSWTLDRERAEWFAWRSEARFGYRSNLFEVDLHRGLILAALLDPDGRGEQEVIVNPNRLRGLRSPRSVGRLLGVIRLPKEAAA